MSAKENTLHGNAAEAAPWIGFDAGDDGMPAADGGVADGDDAAEFADGEAAAEGAAGCAAGAEAGGDGMPVAGEAVVADEGAAEFVEGADAEGAPEQPVNTAKMDATNMGARIRRGDISPIWLPLVISA